MGALDRIFRGRRSSQRTIPQQVAAALKRYDAHLYLPGPGGVTVQSFRPGNYVESTGVTPGSVDGLVGLALDAAGSVGDDILGGAGTFDSASGWTLGSGWSISGGAAVASTATAGLIRSAPVLANRSYLVTYDIVSYTSGTVRANVGGSTNGVINSSLGTKSEVINSAWTDGKVYLGASNFVGQIDNFTVREVTGIHASQVTQGYKPWLRRGIVNLLTYSQDFSNVAWNKTAISVSGAQVAAAAVSSEHYFDDSAATSFVASSAYTKAALVKPNGLRYVRLAFPSTAFPSTGRAAWFDLQSGTVGTVQAGVTANVRAVGDSFLCAISATANATASAKGFTSLATNDGGSLTFVGDGSSGIYLYSAGLFQGVLTAQQILDAGGIPLTTNAPASSANGKYYWQFDGSDDRLVLGSVPFQMSDDHCVIAAATCGDASTIRSIFDSRSTTLANPLVANLITGSSGQIAGRWRDDAGTALVVVNAGSVSTGETFVASLRKVGNTKAARKNGVQGGSDTTALGVSSANSATIGATIGTTMQSYFNGAIYPTLAIKGTVSDADLKLFEKWIGSLAGVTL